MTARSSNDVWAVGVRANSTDLARTLIVHWNGTAWSDLGGPNGPVGNSGLADITVAPIPERFGQSVPPAAANPQTNL